MAFMQLGMWNKTQTTFPLNNCRGSSNKPKAEWPSELSLRLLGEREVDPLDSRLTESDQMIPEPSGLKVFIVFVGWGHSWR